MSLPEALTKDQLGSILAMYRLDAPGASAAPLKDPRGALYRVRVQGADYVLRLLHRRSVDEMVFEKDLLLHLGRLGFAVPRLLQNTAKGSFTPWTRRGRYVSLFRYPEGRSIGRFEVRAAHLRRIGAWLARFHRATEVFPKQRRPSSGSTIEAKLERLTRALDGRRLAQRHRPMVETLQQAADALPPRAELPSGLVHGRLGLSAVRFRRNGRLSGVTDFEQAHFDAWLMDVARVVVEWCWCPHASSEEGPRGEFRLERLQAFLRSYVETRPLLREEWAMLDAEIRRVCIDEATQRLVDGELRPRRSPYLDPRHYVARLGARLEGLGPTAPCERSATGLASPHS